MLPVHVPVPLAAANVVPTIGCSPDGPSGASATRTVTAVTPVGSGLGAATTSTREITVSPLFL